jgi:hypothetical protein
MKNKKGSHVDVVISFVIFIMFVVFIFILVRPAGDFEKDHKQTLEYLKLEIGEQISGEILTINLVNSSVQDAETCVSVDTTDLSISGLDSIAKNFDGDTLDSFNSGGVLQVEWNGESSFRTIYAASDFNSHVGSSGTCDSGVIKSTRESEEILESKIIDLILSYNSDYESLKSSFKISNREDFDFQFDYDNGTILGTGISEVRTEIYVEKYQVNYLDKEANRKSGYILLFVWG